MQFLKPCETTRAHGEVQATKDAENKAKMVDKNFAKYNGRLLQSPAKECLSWQTTFKQVGSASRSVAQAVGYGQKPLRSAKLCATLYIVGMTRHAMSSIQGYHMQTIKWFKNAEQDKQRDSKQVMVFCIGCGSWFLVSWCLA